MIIGRPVYQMIINVNITDLLKNRIYLHFFKTSLNEANNESTNSEAIPPVML